MCNFTFAAIVGRPADVIAGAPRIVSTGEVVLTFLFLIPALSKSTYTSLLDFFDVFFGVLPIA